MKVYLAAAFSRKQNVANIADLLERFGVIFTSRWYRHESADFSQMTEAQIMDRKTDYAIMDLREVDQCDVLVVLSEPVGSTYLSGGRHVEFGYALSAGKRVVVIGADENIFHHHPGVHRFNDFEDFLDSGLFTRIARMGTDRKQVIAEWRDMKESAMF